MSYPTIVALYTGVMFRMYPQDDIVDAYEYWRVDGRWFDGGPNGRPVSKGNVHAYASAVKAPVIFKIKDRLAWPECVKKRRNK